MPGVEIWLKKVSDHTFTPPRKLLRLTLVLFKYYSNSSHELRGEAGARQVRGSGGHDLGRSNNLGLSKLH